MKNGRDLASLPGETMASLLKVDVSPRGDYSISRKLGEKFLADWKSKNSGGTVVVRDLSQKPLPFVDLPWIVAAYSTPDQHTPEQQAAIKVSDELIDELLAADEILITTPMYNFAIPAALKGWVDHIVRIGRTFSASYEGLAKGKKVTVIIASGGNYAPGAYAEKFDHFSEYIRFILGFIGITDVTVEMAGDTNNIAQGKITMDEYLKTLKVAIK
jgi:FMN-dependent NADH-azoreductase